MHSVTGLYFRVLCLPRSMFFPFGLCFQDLFPDVFPHACDLSLGSSVIIAVNLLSKYCCCLSSLTDIVHDGFPTCSAITSGSMDKCHKIPCKSWSRAENSQSGCLLSSCVYSAFSFNKGLKVAAQMCTCFVLM